MTAIFVDGRNIVCRFGYVFRSLSAPDGTKTGALYGTLQCLMRLKRKFPGSRIVVVWDGKESKERGWRRAAYPQYKANRTGANEEIKNLMGQLPLIGKSLTTVGIEQCEISHLEADDVISVLAMAVKQSGNKSIIYSSDQDYLQLLTHGIEIIPDIDKANPLAFASAQSINKKFGCTPEKLLLLRAIIGDSSDNIAGAIKGVGPKTALKLVDTKEIAANARVIENYSLMRLPLTPDDEHFTQKQRDKLTIVVSNLLAGSILPAATVYSDMLNMCGDLNLKTAMEHRRDLWNLHCWE